MRPQALASALRAPSLAVEIRSVPPTGDCFYDALDLQLPKDGRVAALGDAGAMRDFVADSINQEVFDLMNMYAQAGVEGYEWLRHHRGPRDLDAARAFAKRRGKESGAGQCLWADEHALQTVAKLAGLRILIIDEQAPSSGSRSGRRRGNDDGRPDSRFVCVGDEGSFKAVLLHRSRRQHFSPIFIDGKGVLDVRSLPAETRGLWPSLAELPKQEVQEPTPPNGSDVGLTRGRKRLSTDDDTKIAQLRDCIPDRGEAEYEAALAKHGGDTAQAASFLLDEATRAGAAGEDVPTVRKGVKKQRQ